MMSRKIVLVLAMALAGGGLGLASRAWSRDPQVGVGGLDGLTNWLEIGPLAINPGVTNGLSVKPPAKRTLPLFATTNWPGVTNLFLYSQQPAKRLAPGLYEAAPYTCLVLVPGSHLDDKFVVDPGKTGSQMPVIKPELRLIPRKISK